LIFQRQGALWATRFDPVRAEVSGEPVRIVENVEITSPGFALYDVARDGTLVYFPAGRSRLARSLVWVDRQGKETPLPAAPSPYESPRISPDGRSIVVQVTDQDSSHLAMIDLERSVLTPITFGTDGELYPIWTRRRQTPAVQFRPARREPEYFFESGRRHRPSRTPDDECHLSASGVVVGGRADARVHGVSRWIGLARYGDAGAGPPEPAASSGPECDLS